MYVCKGFSLTAAWDSLDQIIKKPSVNNEVAIFHSIPIKYVKKILFLDEKEFARQCTPLVRP